MRVYVGIDLHSSNCYLVVLDEEGRVLFEKKLANDLGKTLQYWRRSRNESRDRCRIDLQLVLAVDG